MKILLANKYFYLKGGAEHSFFETARLLQSKQHEIVFFSMHHPRNVQTEYQRYFVSNVDYDVGGVGNALRVAPKLLYSLEARRNMTRLIRDSKPDLAHLNNIYHQLSPSILHAAKESGLPSVMSLRDYKLVCASYAMLAEGQPCEACRGGKYYQAVVKKCVKGSLVKSLLNTVEMYLHHDILDLYGLVNVFISPSRFLKAKVEEMGFKGRIVYIPNFVDAQSIRPQFEWTEQSIVYFGRLSKEKGLETLVEAARRLKWISVKLIGEGPYRQILEARVRERGVTNVRFLGYMVGEALRQEIRNSMAVVLPSEWYENNPRTVLEGFALGKLSIGARIGGIPELVKDGETGLTFSPGNVEELVEKITSLESAPDEVIRMGKNARAMVETEFNPTRHYAQLMKVYESAMAN